MISHFSIIAFLFSFAYAYIVKTNIFFEGFMRDYIEERAIHIAQYIVDNGATVRQTARQFGVSKSTVHKDVTQRLIQINPRLAFQTRDYSRYQ